MESGDKCTGKSLYWRSKVSYKRNSEYNNSCSGNIIIFGEVERDWEEGKVQFWAGQSRLGALDQIPLLSDFRATLTPKGFICPKAEYMNSLT